MAELKKEGASTAQPKANTSLLDEEIGKEFLNSWNAGADALDFNSETVPQSKKKTFNFDKLDMDFGLDGGFDKISSFTIDMSDLDFSSPPRKVEKPKERSGKESVPGKQERKEDSFTFSFDFKELDGFDLDSSLVKGGKESDKCTNDKGLPSFISSGSSPESINNSTSNIDTQENFDIKKLKKLDGLTSNLVPPSASQDMDTATNDVPLVTQKHGNQDVLRYANSPEKRTNTFAMENRLECHEAMQHREQPETTGSKEPCVQHSIKDIAVQSVSIEDLVLVSAPELQTEAAVISLSMKEDNNVKAVPSSFTPEPQTGPAVTSLSRKADNNVKGVPSSPFQDSCSIITDNLEHLPPICMTELKDTDAEFQKYSESHNHAMEDNDAGKETAHSDTGFEDVSLRNISQKLHDVSASGDKPNLVMKDQLLVDRESTVDKLSPLKGKGIGVIRSKYFNKSGDAETTLLSTSAPKKVYALCNKKLGRLHLGHADQRSLKIGGSEEEPRNHMVGISESNSSGLKKGLPLKTGNSSSDKVLNTSGFQIHLANSSEPSSMYSTPKSKNPELEVSSKGPLRNSNPFSVHIHKVSSLKPNVKSFDVSGLSAASTMASKSEPSDSSVQKEIRSLRQPEENRGMHVNMASKITHSVSSIAPIRSSKHFSVDKNKASPLTPNAAPLNILILNATSTLTSKGEPVHSAFHKEVRSLKKPDGSMGMHVSIESKMAHSANKEQTPLCSSLKRKSLEEPCPGPVNLNPLKRITESSSESREDRKASKRTEEKMPTALLEACPDASMAGLEVPATALLEACPDASMAGLEVPVLLESNGKVEKAEACAKELEAIYNMLKRKHDEAKEVLVRTIVNNNLLLMLNHPAYEEKVSFHFFSCYVTSHLS